MRHVDRLNIQIADWLQVGQFALPAVAGMLTLV